MPSHLTDGAVICLSAGVALILLGIGYRALATVWIGGHKNFRLIQTGPFSFSRNPLYVGWVLAVTGIGLLHGSLVLAALLGVSAWLIFDRTIRREEIHLLERFGDDYATYMHRVPRWAGRVAPKEWPRPIAPNGKLVWKTVYEASLLLLALPFEYAVWWAQNHHLLPVLWHW